MTPPPPPLALIADNDPGIASMLQQSLVVRGFGCETVSDGAAALTRLQEGGVDLLVTDLDMPGMGGRDLLARLQDLPQAPPALVISGYLDRELEDDLQALPEVRGVLGKPFDLFEFADLAWQIATASGGADAAGAGSA